MSDRSDSLDEVARKLDAVVGLLALLVADSDDDEQPSITSRIRVLDSIGLPAADIARAIGKKPKYVHARLGQMRKKGGSK